MFISWNVQQTPEKPAVVVTETEARAVAAAAQARGSFLDSGHLNHRNNTQRGGSVGPRSSEGVVFCGNVFNDEPTVPVWPLWRYTCVLWASG
jgi:hypothetical protein